MKTSLDAWNIKESNELGQKIPSYLKFLRKVRICAFAVLIFWQFSENIQKLVPRIPFGFSDPVFALRRLPENSKTGYSQKRRMGLLGGKLGHERSDVWVNWLPDHVLGPWEKTVVNYLVCSSKCSRSYSEAAEILISLSGWGVKAKNWLGHLVDVLIFFANKFFLSLFWLEIWRDVARHPNTPVLRLWWGSWVLTSRKVAWTEKKTKSMVFAPLNPHQIFFNFFDHHYKRKVFIDIFYVESFIPTCLVWALWLFEWTQLVFLAYTKTGFPVKRRHRFAQPTSKDAVLSTGSGDSSSIPCAFTGSNSIHSEVMTNHNLECHYSLPCGAERVNRSSRHCFTAMCDLSFFNNVREDKVLQLFSVSITSVSYSAGRFSIVAARYDSTVMVVSNSYNYLSSEV